MSWSWLLTSLCPCLGRDKSHEPQVSGLLADEETSGGPDFGYALNQNDSRRNMEDAESVCEDVGGYRMFAVFDGHAGMEAVVAAQRILPEILGSFLRGGLDVKTCILEAFGEAHDNDNICQKLLKRPDASEETEFSSGSVVCVALIEPAIS